ncbi:MAG: hypothetical protein U0236_16045 [Nitrospira sp.]
MARQATTAELIVEALATDEAKGCSFEELLTACPGLTWNQVFFEVDRLSRDSRIQLNHEKPGGYCIRLPRLSCSTAPAPCGE